MKGAVKLKRVLVSIVTVLVLMFSLTSIAFAENTSREVSGVQVSIPQELREQALSDLMESIEAYTAETFEDITDDSDSQLESIGVNPVSRYSFLLDFNQVIYYEVYYDQVDGWLPTGYYWTNQYSFIDPTRVTVLKVPCPFYNFVSEVITAEYGTFTSRYGVYSDDYYGSINISKPDYAGSIYYGSGMTYTLYSYWCGFISQNNEHPTFKAVSRPQGWSTDLSSWLTMY